MWLQWWSNSELEHLGRDQGRKTRVYKALGAAAVIPHLMLLYTSLIQAVPTTSIRLHRSLLDRVMSAPLSFFDTTDSGVTVNRSSQDMSLVDSKLPAARVQTLDGIFLTFATRIIIAISARWAAISFLSPGHLCILTS